MRIKIEFDCDSFDEAKELIACAQRLTTLPYRLEGFGPPVLKTPEPHEPSPSLTETQTFNMTKPASVVRANVSPGEPSIGKIGADAKAFILASILGDVQIPFKYTEHLKLLWKRKEICFDGHDYYL